MTQLPYLLFNKLLKQNTALCLPFDSTWSLLDSLWHLLDFLSNSSYLLYYVRIIESWKETSPCQTGSTVSTHIHVSVYVWCKTVNTFALCRSFVSSSIVSGGIIIFLCFILDNITGDHFILNMSPCIVWIWIIIWLDWMYDEN